VPSERANRSRSELTILTQPFFQFDFNQSTDSILLLYRLPPPDSTLLLTRLSPTVIHYEIWELHVYMDMFAKGIIGVRPCVRNTL
jgi:hypothetical protein